MYGQHALVIQSGVGDTLVDTILSYYLAEKIKMVPVEGYSKEHPQRESLVAYLWAKKLVKLVEQLSGINK